MFNAHFTLGQVISTEPEAFSLFEKSCFGEKKSQKIIYASFEALYLLENKKIEIHAGNKLVSFDELIKKFRRQDKKIDTRYQIFSDLRSKGYIVKTALKFGAEFRVYDKGHWPGEEHARWILYTAKENEVLAWHEFAAKNRVAHSTNKHLLLAIVDEEGDVSYYQTGWLRV